MTDFLCAIDTNILVYAEGVNGPEKSAIANSLLDRLAPVDITLAVQTLGELFHVLTRKTRYTPAQASAAVGLWRQQYTIVPTSVAVFENASSLAASSGYQIWDAVILAAAAEAGCRLLLSEDMHEGFVYRGVTIANPFAERLHPLLASLLEDLPGAPL
ncbi:PIN domain-containing protein [soil metagenome]